MHMGDITALGKLFTSTEVDRVDTGEFVSRVAELLATDENAKAGCDWFEVFVCELEGRFRVVKERHVLLGHQILPWLFDHCGTGGMDIFRTDEGHWARWQGQCVWAYPIYVERKV